jgi:hypothetical protein
VIRPRLHGRVEQVYEPVLDVDFTIFCHDICLTGWYTSYSG